MMLLPTKAQLVLKRLFGRVSPLCDAQSRLGARIPGMRGRDEPIHGAFDWSIRSKRLARPVIGCGANVNAIHLVEHS